MQELGMCRDVRSEKHGASRVTAGMFFCALD